MKLLFLFVSSIATTISVSPSGQGSSGGTKATRNEAALAEFREKFHTAVKLLHGLIPSDESPDEQLPETLSDDPLKAVAGYLTRGFFTTRCNAVLIDDKKSNKWVVGANCAHEYLASRRDVHVFFQGMYYTPKLTFVDNPARQDFPIEIAILSI